MHITSRIGNFIVRTDRVIGNPHAVETYLTLVTRNDSFWDLRTCYNAAHASEVHNELCRELVKIDPELTVCEAQIVQSFKDEHQRVLGMVRHLSGF